MSGLTRAVVGLVLAVWIAPALEGASIECVAGCGKGPLGGPAREAELKEPFGVAFDREGNWYICEYRGHRITRVDRRGVITLFAGTGEAAAGGDGGPARAARFNQPHSLYVRGGRLYIADMRNHQVRRVDLRSGIITTVAGAGEAGFSGDGGPAAQARLRQAYDVAVDDSERRLYVDDLGNRRIRLVDLRTGIVTTVAGTGQAGVPEDGAKAMASPLVDPRAIVLDRKGNLYILERRGNALRVVDRKGTIRTVVSPTSVQPPMNGPKHLCLDGRGNVLIADTENHVIRKYSPRDGSVAVIAGTGQRGDRIVAADPLQTQLNRPHGVYVHPSGDLYISDSENNRVLKVTGW